MDGNQNQNNNNVTENTDQNVNSGAGNGTQQNQNQQNTQQNQNNNSTGNNGGSNGGSTEKQFTQTEVSRMMANEKRQGRNAAFSELGIDPNDTATMNMLKAFLSAQKTPEQQNAEQLQAQQIKNAELEHKAKVAEAKAEALMMGADPQYVDDIITIAVSKVTETTDIKSVLTEMKTKYSVWFGGQQNGTQTGNQNGGNGNNQNRQQNQTGQNGTGSAVGNNNDNSGNNGNKGLGATLAARRKNFGGSGQKSSYWGTN